MKPNKTMNNIHINKNDIINGEIYTVIPKFIENNGDAIAKTSEEYTIIIKNDNPENILNVPVKIMITRVLKKFSFATLIENE